MKPFSYARVASERDAVAAMASNPALLPTTSAPRQFIAGGTNVMDYFKLDCWQAESLVDVNDLRATHGRIEATSQGLRLGALVRMSEAADDPIVRRDYPVIAQSLALAASTQIRNMASLGGNVLQRTRCSYFRDAEEAACNKRNPGSGCAAIGGNNRTHAVLGVSEGCISCYPGDFAQALMALDASVMILGRTGGRTMRFADLHTSAEHPERETNLAPDELITAILVPAGAHTRRSRYVKIRDRQSYEYGLATAAVALDLDGDRRIRDARIALGGVAYRPWRASDAEAWLVGKSVDETTAHQAGMLAFDHALAHRDNAYKVQLGPRTVTRALLEAAEMEI